MTSSLSDDVAVVVPLYNGARWIEATLDAVAAQTHAPAEVVVVDNGSSDDGPARVAARPGVRLVACAEPGTDLARRAGLAATTAPLVALLDQDDLWHPDFLATMAAALARHPDAAVAAGQTDSFADGAVPRFVPPTGTETLVDPWAVFPGCFTPTPSAAVVRRAALDEAGGWAEGYLGATDFFMWLRLAQFRPFVRVEATLAAHRRHPTSHNETLRSEQTGTYLDHIARAAGDALDERATHHAGERPALDARRRLVDSARALYAALDARDTGAAREAAAGFEAAAGGVTPRQAEEALGLVLWLMSSEMHRPESYDAVWRLLIEQWPLRARHTGQLRFALTSLRPVLASLRRAPSEPWRWRFAAAQARFRLAARRAA